MLESRVQKRNRFIEYIYKFELLGESFSHVEAFESGNFTDKEIKMIENIKKNYDKYRKLVSAYLSDNWTWERISPLERAILVFGAFELPFSNKGETINELVNYAKIYIQPENHKFINAVLDKIGTYYEQIRASQKTN